MYAFAIGTAAFIDAEHAMDPLYARNLGVKVDDLLLCQVGSHLIVYRHMVLSGTTVFSSMYRSDDGFFSCCILA